MKITSFETFQFKIPLKQELKINNQKVNIRQGLIVKITDDMGNCGYGEISPLPGLHKETLSQASNQLKTIKNLLLQNTVTGNIEQIIENLFSDSELSSSVRFGLETAIYRLFAVGHNVPILSLFSQNPFHEININGLLSGSEKKIIERAKFLINKGYTTLKVKVGRESIDSEIKLIKLLLGIIENRAVLRLDANRKWSLQEAVSFLKGIGSDNIEYIEEPLSDPSKLEDLYLQTNFPFALDESIIDIDPTKYTPPNWCKAFVLKPTIIGSIQKTMQFIHVAEKHSISPIICDTFQSGVGLSMLVAISASVKNNRLAMGLDTYNYLETDILEIPIKFNQNKLVVNQVLDYSNKIDLLSLIPILL
ncbi:o-succinylbenzoate synthase [Calditrichota bacterium]